MREHMEINMLAQALVDAGFASTTPINTDADKRQSQEDAMWLLRDIEKRRSRRNSRRRK
jgi:hypothetical protein